jgi:HPt (histidine-containing phosphotransfer) domain-containing protein
MTEETDMETKYIDLESALSRVGGNEGLYKRLLGKFESSIDMAGFDANIAAKDYLKAGEIVHAAKGIAGNLSLNPFFEASSKLMEEVRNGGTPVDADVEAFRALYAETKTAITEFLAE